MVIQKISTTFLMNAYSAIISKSARYRFPTARDLTMSKPLLSCALGLVLAACAQSPTVTLTDIRPLAFGLLEQSYLIKLRIQNPNALPAYRGPVLSAGNQ
jgi:hypothetical protein